MKKFINFIIKTLILIVAFAISLSLVILAFMLLFSTNKNLSVTETVAEFQSIGKELVDSALPNKVSINLLDDNTISKESDIIDSSNTVNKEKYYYNQLDNTGKIIYNKLENNINNLKKENYILDFSTQFNDLLHEPTGQNSLNRSFQSALDAFTYDYPELFYIDITKISLLIKSTSIGPLTNYTVSISPNDNKNYLSQNFNNEAEVDIAISKIENIKKSVTSKITELNDYKKICSIHNSLVNSLEYDGTFSRTNTHNIYGALIEKNVVCEGYAKAFKYLLDSIDIENILVSGTAINSSGELESHMWNYVKLNGNWYGVDVTWDDPIIIGGSSKNNLRQTYLLKGNRTFSRTHNPSGQISDTGIQFTLPSLSAENYKY